MVATATKPTEYQSLLQEYGAAAADVRKAHTTYRNANRAAERAERSYREAEAALFVIDAAACGYVAHGSNDQQRKDRRAVLLAGNAIFRDGDPITGDEHEWTHPGLGVVRTLWDTAEAAKDDAIIQLEHARHLLTMARFALVGYLDTAVDRVNEEAEEGMPF